MYGFILLCVILILYVYLQSYTNEPFTTVANQVSYVRCIGLSEEDYQTHLQEKIPCYHVNAFFLTLSDILKRLDTEVNQLRVIGGNIGPCYILIAKRPWALETRILFPNFTKNKKIFPNEYGRILSHRWVNTLINNPYYAIPTINNMCGFRFEDLIFYSAYSSRYSNCPGENITCGCTTCMPITNQYVKDNPPSTYQFAVYTPNYINASSLDLSYMISGQEITFNPDTIIYSDNRRYKLAVVLLQGLCLFEDDRIIWQYPVNSLAANYYATFEQTTLSFTFNGRVVWQKDLLPPSQIATTDGPYLFKLTNEGKFSLIDSNGKQIFI